MNAQEMKALTEKSIEDCFKKEYNEVIQAIRMLAAEGYCEFTPKFSCSPVVECGVLDTLKLDGYNVITYSDSSNKIYWM